jgi:hypothetical protein
MKKSLLLAVHEVQFVKHTVLKVVIRDRSLDITTVYVYAPTTVKYSVLKNNLGLYRECKRIDLFSQFPRHSVAIW